MKRNKNIISLVSVLLIGMPMSLLASGVVNNSVVNNTSDGRYLIHDDGTATDTMTGLMWQRCHSGMTFDGFVCAADTDLKLSWNEALEYAVNAEYAGYDDWRLPSRQEAFSLVSMNRAKPAFNDRVFPIPSAASMSCWTSSSHVNDFINAWSVHYDTGSSDYNDVTLAQGVWLVRGGY